MVASSGGQRAPVKPSGVMNGSRYIPNTSQSSLIVGVRVRPLINSELAKGGRKDIIRVIDGRIVVVLDPDESKDYLDQVQNRTKEKQYTYDIAFDAQSTNMDVYNGTVRDLVSGVLYGINTTVFAYGATGSGKTYTMVGTPDDPGLMLLSLEKIFEDRQKLYADEEFEVTCSYLEVYNEVIYDLLIKNSGPLELREDPELGVTIAGLRQIQVNTPDDILDALDDGNRRRKTESTDANSQSSRSHAVLEINIRRTPKNHYKVQQLRAKLALVDLAGSERAAETNNDGRKLRDGANINRSLLALANCINALGKAGGSSKGAAYVPYRNSKLTRLLKDGLSGNSRTAMITTVSASSDQYHHSINTLKYADRAKEIKTHVVQNVGTVESHVADYQRIIDNLQGEVMELKSRLADRATPPPGTVRTTVVSSEDEMMIVIDQLVQEMNDNIEERINQQKALFEIEDAALYNKYELKQLDEFLEAGLGGVKDITEARDRKADVVSSIKEHEVDRDEYKAEIASNEDARKDIQARIDKLVAGNENVAFLNLVGTFRLQAVRLQELKFQMAVRDQIISEQREVISNLWRIIDHSGMGRQKVLEIAKQEGIIMDGFFQLSEESTDFSNGHAGANHNSNSINGRKKRESLGIAGDHGASTPNALLAGNRAKMRYQFWQDYGSKGGAEGGGKDEQEAEESPSPAAKVGIRRSGGIPVRNGKKELPLSARRRPGAGGAGRGAGSAPARQRLQGGRGAGAGAGGNSNRDAASPTAAAGRKYPMSARGAGGRAEPSRASDAVMGRLRKAPPPPATNGNNATAALPARAAVAAALKGVGNNQTAPVVRSGRRAGQPAAGHHLEDITDTDLEGDLALELPQGSFTNSRKASLDLHPGHAGPRAMSSEAQRRHDALMAAMAHHQSSDTKPPLPAPPTQAPLSERLAKLRGRLGRRSEADGLMGGLPAEPADPSNPPGPKSSQDPSLKRQTSVSSRSEAPADALDVLKESIRRRVSGSGT